MNKSLGLLACYLKKKKKKKEVEGRREEVERQCVVVHVLYGDQGLNRTMKELTDLSHLIVHLQTPTCVHVCTTQIRCTGKSTVIVINPLLINEDTSTRVLGPHM